MAKRGLGELEGEVLGVLWSAHGALTPAEVQVQLRSELAYTTVMTILSRLWQKGQASRTRRGRAFEYSPAQSEADFGATQLADALSTVNDRSGALSRFVGRLTAAEARELRSALENRRRGSG